MADTIAGPPDEPPAVMPGRQRHYAMYFSSAKRSKTRAARIERYRGKILDGKEMRDR